MNIDLGSPALDTVITRYTNYPPGGAVELWTINGASHYIANLYQWLTPAWPSGSRITIHKASLSCADFLSVNWLPLRDGPAPEPFFSFFLPFAEAGWKHCPTFGSPDKRDSST